MRETGILITCDRCDTNGTFIHNNQYDVYPEDWSHYDGKDICPTCSEELHILAEQLDFLLKEDPMDEKL